MSSNSIFPLILNLVDFWTIIHRSKLLLKDDGYTLLLSDLLNLFSWPQEGAVNTDPNVWMVTKCLVTSDNYELVLSAMPYAISDGIFVL